MKIKEELNQEKNLDLKIFEINEKGKIIAPTFNVEFILLKKNSELLSDYSWINFDDLNSKNFGDKLKSNIQSEWGLLVDNLKYDKLYQKSYQDMDSHKMLNEKQSPATLFDTEKETLIEIINKTPETFFDTDSDTDTGFLNSLSQGLKKNKEKNEKDENKKKSSFSSSPKISTLTNSNFPDLKSSLDNNSTKESAKETEVIASKQKLLPSSFLNVHSKSGIEKLFNLIFDELIQSLDFDFSFLNLNEIQNKYKDVDLSKIEKINQKIINSLNEENLLFSEDLFLKLFFYYFLLERTYEGIFLIKKYLPGFKDSKIFLNLLGNFYLLYEKETDAINSFHSSIEYMEKENLSSFKIYSPYFSLGFLYKKKGNYDLAFQYLKISEIKFQNNITWIQSMAEIYEIKNFKPQALKYYIKYLNINPKNSDILLKVFDISYALLNSKCFFIFFEKVKSLNIDIDIHQIYFKQINMLMYDDKIDQAYDIILKKFINLDGFKNFEGQFKTLSLNEVKFNFKKDQEYIILKYYLYHISLDKYDALTFFILEKIFKNLNLDYIEFLKTDLIEIQTHEQSVLIQLAEQAKRYNLIPLAYHYIKKSKQINNQDLETLQFLAELDFVNNKNTEEAIEILLSLEKKNKINCKISFLIIQYYFKKNLFSDAIYFIEKYPIQKENPHYNESLFLFAKIYFELKKYSQSLFYLSQAILIEPDNEEILFYLGLCYKAQKNYKEALAFFKQVLEKNPSHKDAHLYLYEIYNLILKTESEKNYSMYID